jgi:type IV fimbrial biogenesis protein FimT
VIGKNKLRRTPDMPNLQNRTVVRPRRSAATGFTLIELLVTVTVFGILVAMAIPNFRDLVDSQRVKAVTGDLFASLAFARSEAIKRNDLIAICTKTDDGFGCQNSPDWARGWIVFIDTDGNGYPGAVSDILKRQDAIGNVTLVAKDSVNADVPRVTYKRDGRLKDTDKATVFSASSPNGSHIPVRTVSLDLSGRPNIK